MRKIFIHILFVVVLGMLSGCYGYRQVGLLQEHDDLPQYDSAAYEPYRLQVNDEIICRVVTMDETIAKTLSANNNGSGQDANSYRIYSDGTVDIPFLPPVKLVGLT
jgi:polysaccharide export outer membrane protein